jgi:hypothetical protein
MSEPQPTRSTGDQARPWWRDHLGWSLGGVPILLALIRVAVVAQFDPWTAGVIVSTADTLAILSNVFFVLTPLLLLIGLDIAAHRLRAERETVPRRPRSLLLGLSPLPSAQLRVRPGTNRPVRSRVLPSSHRRAIRQV